MNGRLEDLLTRRKLLCSQTQLVFRQNVRLHLLVHAQEEEEEEEED
jgi:hypothetical protein